MTPKESYGTTLTFDVGRHNSSLVSHSQLQFTFFCIPRRNVCFLKAGPSGEALVVMVGEGHGQHMIDFVEAAVEYFSNKNSLDQTPIRKCRSLTSRLSHGINFFSSLQL